MLSWRNSIWTKGCRKIADQLDKRCGRRISYQGANSFYLFKGRDKNETGKLKMLMGTAALELPIRKLGKGCICSLRAMDHGNSFILSFLLKAVYLGRLIVALVPEPSVCWEWEIRNLLRTPSRSLPLPCQNNQHHAKTQVNSHSLHLPTEVLQMNCLRQ